jgi:hypothetical protein
MQMLIGWRVCARSGNGQRARDAAVKVPSVVILSEAKNPSSIQAQEKKPREILRFAQNDNALGFSAACKAALSLSTPRRG